MTRLVEMSDTASRCEWVGTDPIEVAYHDQEWGVPLRDDALIFEFLILEGAQVGLNWITILRKRKNYRAAYCGFKPEAAARFGAIETEALLRNPGIVRNRLKVESAISNARAILRVQQEMGSFSQYIWSLAGGVPRVNHWRSLEEIPAKTPDSVRRSQALKKRGFSIVGPTICYAFMQATGMVNDHVTSCFRHPAAGAGS